MTEDDWIDQISSADPYADGDVPQHRRQASISSLFKAIDMENGQATDSRTFTNERPWWQSKPIVGGSIAAAFLLAVPVVLMTRDSSIEIVAEPSPNTIFGEQDGLTPATEPSPTTVVPEDGSPDGTDPTSTKPTPESVNPLEFGPDDSTGTTIDQESPGPEPDDSTGTTIGENPETLVRSCQHDSNAAPNPLGLRSGLTIEQRGSDSIARFDVFGNAAGEGRSIKIEEFPGRTAEEVLELLKNDESLFLSIIGDSGPEATKFSDLTIVCNP